MTNKIFYVLALPKNAETRGDTREQRNVAKQGSITTGSGITESISLNPDERLLTGWFRGTLAQDMAQEFEQLFGAQGIDVIPVYGQSSRVKEEGYYTAENVNVSPPENRQPEVQTFDGTIVKKGTRESHFRAVETNVIQVDNDFGNNEAAYIGVPTPANDVRWFDSVSKNRIDATVVETRNAEHGDIDIVDATEPSFDEPILIYDLDYNDEGNVDVSLWDDHNRSKTTSVTIDGTTQEYVQWMRVFDTQYVFSGLPVFESGRLRVRLDPSTNTLEAYQWDDANQTYSSVSLGTSNWKFSQYDITYIGDETLEAQLEFYNTSTGSYYSLDSLLRRGANRVQFTVPPNESPPTPSGLLTLLDPIASNRVLSAQETKTVLDKNEVRK